VASYGWAIRGSPRTVVRDLLHENPAVAFLVYSPRDESATSRLHHTTGRNLPEAPSKLVGDGWKAVHSGSSPFSQTSLPSARTMELKIRW
jgi:hypothetical protein